MCVCVCACVCVCVPLSVYASMHSQVNITKLGFRFDDLSFDNISPCHSVISSIVPRNIPFPISNTTRFLFLLFYLQ